MKSYKIIKLKMAGIFLACLAISLNPAKSLALNEPYRPAYVAFGDSLTTGSSNKTCVSDRKRSPWGCLETFTPAMPYPDRVARALKLSYGISPTEYPIKGSYNSKLRLYRAGIWGYSVHEAVEAQKNGRNAEGDWLTQLDAIEQATQLVTGSLGINDIGFSNVGKWARLYMKPGGDHVGKAVNDILAQRESDFDKLFASLQKAKQQGAYVVLGLYYNPYDSIDGQCKDLKIIGNRIVDTLNDEIFKRARANGMQTADFRPYFRGHGSGSQAPYVFGTQCSLSSAIATLMPTWLGGGGGKAALSVAFDPHPNNNGTEVMARVILEAVNGAD